MSEMPDFDMDYLDDEPYSIDDDTWGTCPECGSGLENWGAHSDGDGDMYDLLGCPLCQEERGRANEKWYDDEGESFDSQEEMNANGTFRQVDCKHGEAETVDQFCEIDEETGRQICYFTFECPDCGHSWSESV